METSRLSWIDWMKTLAIFFIIAGHCWVPGNQYIYVFSVPCFFILSGFLSKRETNTSVFWKKLFWNLIVPMCIYWVINIAVQFSVQLVKGSFKLRYLWEAPVLSLIGMQGNDYPAGGLKAMWFVYTLILCKIILQYCLRIRWKKKRVLLVLNVVFLTISWILYKQGTSYCNAIVNVLLAMPFFSLGYAFRKYKDALSEIQTKWLPMLVIIGLVGVWLCGTYNDIVMLYRCSFGSDILLCILGAIFGTVALFAVSMFLRNYLLDFVKVTGGVLW